MSNNKSKQFALGFFESLLVIAYIIFEELIWNIFAKPVYQYLKGLIALDSLKNTMLQMNEHLLLFIFVFIFVIAEVMGVISGISIVNGNMFFGIFIYTVKIPIAAFTFWLFDLTRDKLFTFQWLKRSYEFIMVWVNKLINSKLHVYIKSKMLIARARIKELKIKILGNQSFVASLQNHYVVFKSYCRKYF